MKSLLRYCADCKQPVLRFIPRADGTCGVRLLPGTSKVGGDKKRPHIYLCDKCREAGR